MDSVFVTPPGWSWDIVLYFFFGGIAGGCLFLGAMMRLATPGHGMRTSRIGFYLAFPLINVCAVLLIKDLGVPERFHHMLLQSERLPLPILKWWSPMSMGSWIITVFGVFALISFVHALLEAGVLRGGRLRRWTAPLHDGRGWAGRAFLAGAALFGLLVAGYTGLLLNHTNAPTWSQDPLIAPLFLASGVATAAATMYLLGHLAGGGGSVERRSLLMVGFLALAFEAVLLAAAVALGLAHLSVFFLGWWGVLFWLVIVPAGFVAPLALLWLALFRNREPVRAAPVLAMALLLAGGLLLRTLEVIGGQAYFRVYPPL